MPCLRQYVAKFQKMKKQIMSQEAFMARTVGIGVQNFAELRGNKCFYVDKTSFIKEWWERYDSTTFNYKTF